MNQPEPTLFEALDERQDDSTSATDSQNPADAVKARVALILERAFAAHTLKPLAPASPRPEKKGPRP